MMFQRTERHRASRAYVCSGFDDAKIAYVGCGHTIPEGEVYVSRFGLDADRKPWADRVHERCAPASWLEAAERAAGARA